jgi:2-polyprenyl-6-methoxyphenol hydroxylase-like FAD-dependent oxidoreductase
MSDTSDTQVLIAGGGPVGLTAAIELARRGVACRIVDPLVELPQYAKAVGVQPCTLEAFECMGVRRRILDAALVMRGQIAYVVRPDGYLGLAAACVDPAQLVAHLGATFARPEGDVTG